MQINWNLLQPVDIGGNFQAGWQMGQQLAQKERVKSALAAYSQDPTNPQAQNALAAASPEFAMQLASQRAKADTEGRERSRVGSILSKFDTDPAGARRAALEGGDLDLAKQLSELGEDHRKQIVEMYKGAAPIAYRIRQSQDPAERAAMFQQARPILEAQGWPADKLDQFDVNDNGTLDTIITSAQSIDQLISQNKITWHQQGEQPSFATDAMGRPVGSQNPYAKPNSAASAEPVANGPVDLNDAAALGEKFGRVTSATRTPERNKAVGGVANSYHLKGRAIDIARAPGVSHQEIEAAYKAAGYQLVESLDEGDHSHLAFAAGPGDMSGPVKIASKAEFDKLPSGTQFIAPDGTKRMKP